MSLLRIPTSLLVGCDTRKLNAKYVDILYEVCGVSSPNPCKA